MTEDEKILQGLDLLGDWLDAKGYTEEAGLCTRAMDKINLLKAIASKAIREQRDVMLEERERCARIAEDYEDYEIAAAIREPEND